MSHPLLDTVLSRSAPVVLAAAALTVSACDGGGHSHYGYPACETGIAEGEVDTDAILELDPGYGVAATVEYAGDGGWRFAVACDSALSGYGCDWQLIVSPIDGTIESFEPEGLESGDLIERFPTRQGSREEDGVLLLAYTDFGVDAFTVLATPGAGMRVDAQLDNLCAGPALFWVEDDEVVSSTTNPTDLYPFPPDS